MCGFREFFIGFSTLLKVPMKDRILNLEEKYNYFDAFMIICKHYLENVSHNRIFSLQILNQPKVKMSPASQ